MSDNVWGRPDWAERTKPDINRPPLMVNIRRSELLDSTSIGRGPHGLSTKAAYVGWCLRGQLGKVVTGCWRKPWQSLELDLPLDDAIKWCRVRDEADLVRRLERLYRPFGSLPLHPGEKRPHMRLPVLLDYELRGGKLWYEISRHYLVLPHDDRMYLKLDVFHDALGNKQRFRELMRAAADLDRRKKHGPRSGAGASVRAM